MTILIVVVIIGLVIGGMVLFGNDIEKGIWNNKLSKTERTDHVQAVVSSQELATQAGFEILEAGGTAADAAVAVATTLSVVEPWFSSALGGGTWALYYDASTGKVTSLDGVGPTGSLATMADYSARADQRGIHNSNVPGAWDGWMLWLEKYGSLDLRDVLSPAIRNAREGYPAVSQMIFWLNQEESVILNQRPDTAKIYAPNGRMIREGETVFQHDMANTFEALARVYEEALDGGRPEAIQAARDYYYRGPLAEAIVEYSNRNGGYLTIEDFNEFEAAIVEPVSIRYNDEITVFQNPPASQGATMLFALNTIKNDNLSALGPDNTDAVHLQIEAIKLAFADRYHHIGDPARIAIPIDELLSDEYATNQRARINMNSAMSWPISSGIEPLDQDSHTTTFHITDRYGNAAAVTTSLGAQFLVIGDTGIHINNRMRMISLREGDPNQLTPGFNVRHTSNPYMALLNGKPYIMGGNTGVDTQPQGQMQQFLHVVEFGMSAQEAINRPRFISTAFPAGTYPYVVGNTLQMEAGFPSNLIQELRSRGHNVVVGQGIVGAANMLVVKPDGSDAQIGAESRSTTAAGIKDR